MERWLARVRHDLLKHAAWSARDLRAALEQGTPPRASDVGGLQRALLQLPDADGEPAGALVAWRMLRDDIDIDEEQRPAMAPALDRFEAALSALVEQVAAAPAEARVVEPL